MKRIDFEDKSYIEVSKSPKDQKVFVTVAAKTANNTLTINSVEIDKEELLLLVKSLN